MSAFLDKLLTKAIESGVSDVHVVAGMPPLFRLHTVLEPVEGAPVIPPDKAEEFVLDMVGEKRFQTFKEQRDLDFSTQVPDVGRFRVNAHWQRNTVAIAFRSITTDVPKLETLNLPSAIAQLVSLPRGLVIVTGQTGSGKSTTLASMINEMNHRFQRHVLTLEDPVEYELVSDKCIIEQRELGSDVPTFASGLKHALRQDPDIILVGEMRDLDTTSAAISAAETGHLVLSTLHTQSAAQTIERIIDIYPAGQQNQIRAMLSNTLQAVVSQVLFKRIDRRGMVPACEVMLCSSAVRNCVRENRIHEIPNIIETSRSVGMCTLNDSIKELVLSGKINIDQALAQSNQPGHLKQVLNVE